MIVILNNFINGLSKTPINYLSFRKIKSFYKELYGGYSFEPNLEHIIPQSKLKYDPILKRDMHNILIYPKMLNIHRSNYKYINDETIYDESIILDKLGNITNDEYNSKINSIKTAPKKIFCPNEIYRGEISRSCMYFMYTYDKYGEMIINEVIDVNTLLLWNELYPVTDFDLFKNE